MKKLLLLVPVFLSCGNDRVAGASTETTNGLNGTVYLPGGSAARGARIQFTDASGTNVVGTVSADASGQWSANLPSGTYGVLVVAPDGTRSWTYPRAFSTTYQQSFVTTNPGRLVTGGSTRLAATPFASVQGAYDSLPAGAYTVLQDSSVPWPLGSARILSGDTANFSGVRDSGLLFDDFDAASPGFLYSAWHGQRWFAQNGPSGAALLSPHADSGVVGSLDTIGAWKGKSLTIRYTSADTGSFVQVGHYLPHTSDFTGLRSIRIRARGDGVLRLHLAGSASDKSVIRTQWQATPSGTWTEFVFRPGEELPTGPSDPPRVRWNAISGGVWLLMIQAYGGTWLQVDDIRMDGIDPSVFLDAGR